MMTKSESAFEPINPTLLMPILAAKPPVDTVLSTPFTTTLLAPAFSPHMMIQSVADDTIKFQLKSLDVLHPAPSP
jgi:hypothetical protein